MLVSMNGLRKVGVIGTLVALAACQPPPAPVGPPPPQTPQYAPRAPTPPLGASINTLIPPIRPADGLRQTINRDIGPLETVWHVRAALNVAALSCTGPTYARIVDDYNGFIKRNASRLRSANSAIIAKYRREIGRGYKNAHDRHQTSLYNYWSFSPLRRQFCDQAVQVSQRASQVGSSELNNFGAQALADLEKPFTDFYLAYEKYERDLDAWRRQYAPEQARDAADETINSTGLTGGEVDPDAYDEQATDPGIIESPLDEPSS